MILTYPHKSLTTPSQDVYWIRESDYIESLVNKLKNVLSLNEGIGLSAPQIGINKRVFIAKIGDEIVEFINPSIIQKFDDKTNMLEGCLSVPSHLINVKRYNHIACYSFKLDGSVATDIYKGLDARIIQHEMDHLNGRLIVDYE